MTLTLDTSSGFLLEMTGKLHVLTVPISAFDKTISEESWPPGIFIRVFTQHTNIVYLLINRVTLVYPYICNSKLFINFRFPFFYI